MLKICSWVQQTSYESVSGKPIFTVTYQTITNYNNAVWPNAAQNMLPDTLDIVHFMCQLSITAN